MQRRPTACHCCRLLLWLTNSGLSHPGNGSSLILHSPGQRDDCKTVIDVSKGERWFCSTAEVVAAGWRAAMR